MTAQIELSPDICPQCGQQHYADSPNLHRPPLKAAVEKANEKEKAKPVLGPVLDADKPIGSLMRNVLFWTHVVAFMLGLIIGARILG